MTIDPETAVRKLSRSEISDHLEWVLEGLVEFCIVERMHPAEVLGERLPPPIASRDGRFQAAKLPAIPPKFGQALHRLVRELGEYCDSLRADHEARVDARVDATVEQIWKAEPLATTSLVIADKKTAEPAARITQRHCPATGQAEAVIEVTDEFEGRRVASAEVWLKDIASVIAHAKASGVPGLLAGAEGSRCVAAR